MIIHINHIPAMLMAQAFENEKDFSKWANELDDDAVEFWLYEFEGEEMYEFCAILMGIKKERAGVNQP